MVRTTPVEEQQQLGKQGGQVVVEVHRILEQQLVARQLRVKAIQAVHPPPISWQVVVVVPGQSVVSAVAVPVELAGLASYPQSPEQALPMPVVVVVAAPPALVRLGAQAVQVVVEPVQIARRLRQLQVVSTQVAAAVVAVTTAVTAERVARVDLESSSFVTRVQRWGLVDRFQPCLVRRYTHLRLLDLRRSVLTACLHRSEEQSQALVR